MKVYRNRGILKRSRTTQWSSRFGYLMVAAGASIGLGNIWKFPYLAYRGGGGIFILVYILIVLLLAEPMVNMETAIGRHGRSDTVSVFEKINKRWGFVGWLANLCTLTINFFYVVVAGWVLRYAVQFIISGDFGGDSSIFFQHFITDPVRPLFYSFLVLAVTAFLLFFGITELVEKISKIMLPALFVLLAVCGIYACFAAEGALDGLKYYLLPDFKKMSFKVFADAATQVLFSVGIGWGIFTTLGANVPKTNQIARDSLFISIMDTSAAVLAGFVIIPAAFGAGVDVQKGPALLFDVMAGIFGSLPGGRWIGCLFFTALLIASFSSLFTFIEISVRTFEIKCRMGRRKAILVSSALIGAGNILVSLGFGILQDIKLPWPYMTGIEYYGFYDWLDCFSGYVLLPLGCIFTCIFVWKKWGWKGYEAELTANGRDGRLTVYEKVLVMAVVPLFMVIVLLNVFGFIQ